MKFYTVAASLAIFMLSACSSNPSTEPAKPTITQPKLEVPTTTLPDVVKGAASTSHPDEPIANPGTTTPEVAPAKNTTNTRTNTRTRNRSRTSTPTKPGNVGATKPASVVKPAPVKPAVAAPVKPTPAKPAAAKPQSHQSIGDLLNAR